MNTKKAKDLWISGKWALWYIVLGILIKTWLDPHPHHLTGIYEWILKIWKDFGGAVIIVPLVTVWLNYRRRSKQGD